MDNECSFCEALNLSNETPSLCCLTRKVVLNTILEPPDPLCLLLSNEIEDSKYFLEHTRKFNSFFQMRSFGADITQLGFSPTFTMQGQICNVDPCFQKMIAIIHFYKYISWVMKNKRKI